MNSRHDNHHHVVALSGGKDSTAMALRLAEVEPRDYTYLFTPTGDDPQELLEHVDDLEHRLGPITRVRAEGDHTLQSLIRHFNMLPNGRARWCTRLLKIEPCIAFLESLDAPAVIYVGLRADEPGRVGGIYDDMPQRFPMREWGWHEADVWKYLDRHDVSIPRRTNCNRCYHQRLGEWWNFWRFKPDLYETAVQEEALVSEARGKSYTFRNKSRDTWPASLAELRDEFAAGRIPKGANTNNDLFGGSGQCRVCSL